MAPYYVNGSTEKEVVAGIEKASTTSMYQQVVDPARANVDGAACNLSTTLSTSRVDDTAVSSSTKYRLYAVVYHQGGTQHGHYTARCHLPVAGSTTDSHAWFLFDDE
ncbi:unnamed protein product, partial [Hydatigera taeniaeformis]|uniref:USP domain-containing protein n=1 Tax=Hydatigena taeniaeformis TaxID=6205 RepID=A0A0R3XDA0_HYDTA